MKKGEKIYLVYDSDDDSDDNGYYNQYDTLKDAVRDNEDKDIFEISLKSLGTFNLKVEEKLIKKKKARR